MSQTNHSFTFHRSIFIEKVWLGDSKHEWDSDKLSFLFCKAPFTQDAEVFANRAKMEPVVASLSVRTSFGSKSASALCVNWAETLDLFMLPLIKLDDQTEKNTGDSTFKRNGLFMFSPETSDGAGGFLRGHFRHSFNCVHVKITPNQSSSVCEWGKMNAWGKKHSKFSTFNSDCFHAQNNCNKL